MLLTVFLKVRGKKRGEKCGICRFPPACGQDSQHPVLTRLFYRKMPFRAELSLETSCILLVSKLLRYLKSGQML